MKSLVVITDCNSSQQDYIDKEITIGKFFDSKVYGFAFHCYLDYFDCKPRITFFRCIKMDSEKGFVFSAHYDKFDPLIANGPDYVETELITRMHQYECDSLDVLFFNNEINKYIIGLFETNKIYSRLISSNEEAQYV